MSSTRFQAVEFELRRDGHASRLSLHGRNAWALLALVSAGAKGVTPKTMPTGPRWSAYVHNLRRMGVRIETQHERHGGAFPGTHARYVLMDEVRVVPAQDAA